MVQWQPIGHRWPLLDSAEGQGEPLTMSIPWRSHLVGAQDRFPALRENNGLIRAPCSEDGFQQVISHIILAVTEIEGPGHRD